MAFTQFPNQQYFRVLETDTTTQIGYFNLADGIEIKHMMLTIFQRGLIASPYNLRLKLFGSSSSTTAIVTSNWSEISAATLLPVYASNYLGNIYLDFNSESLNPNLNYYMSVETSGYTRNLDDYYLGINLDWYVPVNNQLDGPNEAGARIRILGNRPLIT